MEKLNIGDTEYEIDVSQITMQEWLEVISVMNQGNHNLAMEKMMRVVIKVLGEKGKSISVVYIPILFPRVIEAITRSLSPGDMESEFDEIVRRNSGQQS